MHVLYMQMRAVERGEDFVQCENQCLIRQSSAAGWCPPCLRGAPPILHHIRRPIID